MVNRCTQPNTMKHRNKETQQQLRFSFTTLYCHEVSEVPDEFTNNVLLPLLVENVMVAPQHDVLVLLGEHHRGILGRKEEIVLLNLHLCVCKNVFCVVHYSHVRESLQCGVLPPRQRRTRSGWWVSCTCRTSSRTECWAGWEWPPGGPNRGTRISNCSHRWHLHREPRGQDKKPNMRCVDTTDPVGVLHERMIAN